MANELTRGEFNAQDSPSTPTGPSPDSGSGQGQAILEVDRVSHRFAGEAGEVEALRDVSFGLAQHEFVSVIGPSGCGKSSLLLMIGGLLRPTEGVLSFVGEAIDGPDPDRVGLIFQDANLFPWRSAIDNVAFPAQLHGESRSQRIERAGELLGLVGLQGFERSYPHQLSGGMRQRVAIARGLMQDPRLLLMDEPFGALDEQTRMKMGAEVSRLWELRGLTALFVTHSIQEAIFLSDRVLVMSARPGRIALELDVDLPRPRDYSVTASPEFNEMRQQIWELIRE